VGWDDRDLGDVGADGVEERGGAIRSADVGHCFGGFVEEDYGFWSAYIKRNLGQVECTFRSMETLRRDLPNPLVETCLRA